MSRSRTEGQGMAGRRGDGIKIVVGLLLSAAWLMGCTASPRVPPPTAASAAPGVGVDPTIEPLLARACYPCHSDDRRDPWFAKIAPSSWTTKGARETLNFSAWSRYDAEQRATQVQMIADAVHKGTMPPADYTFFNHGARLNKEQRGAVAAWAAVEAPAEAR